MNFRVIQDLMTEKVYGKSGLGKWFNQQSAGGGAGWDRYNEKGERVGKCGDAKEGESYAACLSRQKAEKLGKEKIGDFVRRKRKAQKKAGDAAKGGESKKGQKPVFVKTGVTDMEEENKPTNPSLWKKAIAMAKKTFDVYPSAYANAWASKWYKKQGGGWKTVSEDCGCDDEIEDVMIFEGGEPKNVKLNDPFRTPDGPKKFGVYVRNDKGNVVLVRFGDPNLSIKRDQPERLKNFRARHGCDEDPGPKWKAKYWSCKFWEKDSPVSKLLSKGEVTEVVKIQSVEQVAKKHGVSVEKIEKELKMGIKVEMEHTDDPDEAKNIALQHLAEVPDYYTKLLKYVE